jgi:hypothetical protein
VCCLGELREILDRAFENG